MEANQVISRELFIEQLSHQSDAGEEILSGLYDFLVKTYSVKGRYYHNLKHIHKCLLEFFNFKSGFDDSVFGNSQAIFFALWLHDIVYVPGSDLNEDQSAMVAEAILVTKHDRLPKTDEEKLITDIDLSVFALPWPSFLKSREDVFKEYSGLYSKREFTIGQKKFLKEFLDRKKIYHTPYFHNSLEERARENLSRLINS